MLKAFIDDSGSGGDSTWYVLAGYLGTVDGWDSFDSLWAETLHADPYIEYFKGSEAESLRPDGQWAGISKQQRDAKIDALIKVIGQCARRSVCARLRQRDYDDLVKGNVPPMWDSPYYILFTTVVAACINIERLDGESDHVDFVFDSDQRHERQFSLMLPPVSRMQTLDGKLINAVRRDEKKFLPLQAADLLAWQTRRFCEPNNEPTRPHFLAARDCPPKKNELFIMDRAKLSDMVQDMRETAARLAESLGRSPDVRAW
ncbi:MAG TPA: DUF3800 domain-containing protein [Bryobacteraceae bacterium]|jgi:hypothetical protein|nr:DUF3800 domain-containing protein [Bryobacteraceae bacterium]